MSCNEGRILHLLGSTSRSVSNGMMYPPYAPWKRGNLIKYTNQELMCHYLFFREVHRGKEWVCRWSYLLGEIMVVWGLYQAFLSGGGYILSIYREE